MVIEGKRTFWPLIEESLAVICGKERGNILDRLDNLESALQEKNLFQRVTQNKKAPSKDSHILDRPIWNSLTTIHAPFAVGQNGARRFKKNVSIFAGLEDESEESLSALAGLMPKDGNLFLIQVDPVILP